MVGIRLGAAIAASLAFVPVSTPSAFAQPPAGLTHSGRTVWEFEALLHDTFDRLPGLSALSPRRVLEPRRLSPRLRAARVLGHLLLHVQERTAVGIPSSTRRTLVSFGNYPIPIKVRGRFVACNQAETKFLITYGSAVGLGLACLSTHT
jgi:hypothetical protein